MEDTLQIRCKTLLTELGLLPEGAPCHAVALTGGVASDIAKVSVDGKDYCVKFALAKLRVKADWFAPVERNLAEYRWLKTMAEIAPDSSIKLYGHSPKANGFVMSFLDGDDCFLLKTALFEGQGHQNQAEAIGRLLGHIHHHSTLPDFDKNGFDNRDDFYALRIEPYLVYTAIKHPLIAPQIKQMADRLYHAETALVHGDVSPKNIIFKGEQPIILDAECATMGDPCFDVGFCLNHFILKALYVSSCMPRYLRLCLSFWQAYRMSISWEAADDFEARLCQLLPLLILARVDGKSPVEYFNKTQQDEVRDLALALIADAPKTLSALTSQIEYHQAKDK